MHDCGHHLDHTRQKPKGGAWVPYFVVCQACKQLHKAQVAQAKKDGDKDRKEDPDASRVWFVEWWDDERIKAAQAAQVARAETN